MRLDEAVLDFCLSKEVAPTSARWYRQKLLSLVQWCKGQGIADVEALRPLLVSAFLKQLRDKESAQFHRPLSTQTIHGHARAIRAWLRWGVKQGWYDEKDVSRWDMPRAEKKLIKTLSARQFETLLTACDDQTSPTLVARDKAILLLLLDTGIRASELCGLTRNHLHLSLDDSYCVVIGKGNKERVTGGLSRRTASHLTKYLLHYHHPRVGVEAVFLGSDGMGLTRVGLDRMLKRLRDRTEMVGVRISAHTFRHTYATRYLALPGASIYKLKVLLGHTTVSTTEMYVRDFEGREARRGPSVVDGLRFS